MKRVRLPVRVLVISNVALWLGALAAPAAPPDATAWTDAPPLTVPADVLLAAAARVAPEHRDDLAVLWSDSDYAFDARGALAHREHQVYRVPRADDLGAWATASATWAPWYQERPRVEARVIGVDGVVHPLDPATLSEHSPESDDETIFSDQRVLAAPLPALAPGSVVEVFTETLDRAPEFTAGTVTRWRLPWAARLEAARLTVSAAPGIELRWRGFGAPQVEARESSGDFGRRYEAQYGPVDIPREFEADVPADQQPGQGAEFSTGTSWAAIADGYGGILASRSKPHELESWAHEAAKGAPRSEIVARLLSRMHRDVRYTGIEFGEASIVPVAPGEALQRGFGDCKDQATALVAALRAEGIDANVALLRPGIDRDVHPDLPGLGTFTHAIVAVSGEPLLWIDPTDPFSRAGELPESDQGRLALIVRQGTVGLIATPGSAAEQNRISEVREVTLAEWGTGRLVESTEYSGAPESVARAEQDGLSAADAKERFDRYVEGQYIGGKVDRFATAPARDLTRPYTIRLEISDVKRTLSNESRAILALRPGDQAAGLPWALRAKPTDEKPRRADFEIRGARTTEWRYRVVPPPGFKVGRLPANVDRSQGPIAWSQTYSVEADGSVGAVLRLIRTAGRVPAAEFAGLRNAVRELVDAPAVLLSFDQSGAARLAVGDVRGALDVYRDLAARHPAEALHHAQLASALLRGGLGEEARREARRAAELDPKSGLALRVLGVTLQHDEIGRRFGAGCDRAGALAALRKAVELEPKDAVARGDLAILLEHDDTGLRYGETADLVGAIENYQILRKQDEHALDDNLVIALLYLKRFTEALDLLAGMTDTPSHRQLKIDALARSQSPAAAIEEAHRLAMDGPGRQRLLAGAAQDLVRWREFSAAGDLVRAAAADSSEPAGLLGFADVLADVRPVERFDPRSADPMNVVGGLIRAAITNESNAATANMFSSSASHWLSLDGFEQGLAQGFGGASGRLDRTLAPDILVGLVVAGMNVARDGDESVGYQIRLSPRVGNSPLRPRFLVTPENGGYRLAGMSFVPGMAGSEVIARADRGDIAGARRWLDWIWESPEDLPAPMRKLWSHDGQPANAERLRLLGLLLACEAGPSDLTLAAVEASRAAAADDVAPAIDAALAKGYLSRGRYLDAVAAAQRFEQRKSDAELSYQLNASALAKAGRWEDVAALAKTRLAANPREETGLRTLAMIGMHEGSAADVVRLLGELDAAGTVNPADLNNLAWATLFLPEPDARAAGWAQRAAQSGSAAALHTAATVYARSGKTAEAYKLLLQSIGATNRPPRNDDWLVMGAIAESYGLPEVAKAFYRRVEGKPGDGLAAQELAARHLLALGAPPLAKSNHGGRG